MLKNPGGNRFSLEQVLTAAAAASLADAVNVQIAQRREGPLPCPRSCLQLAVITKGVYTGDLLYHARFSRVQGSVGFRGLRVQGAGWPFGRFSLIFKRPNVRKSSLLPLSYSHNKGSLARTLKVKLPPV
jgi:hypothetical protein